MTASTWPLRKPWSGQLWTADERFYRAASLQFSNVRWLRRSRRSQLTEAPKTHMQDTPMTSSGDNNGLPAAAPVVRLVDELHKLPGIGAKNAQRLTYHLVRMPAQGGPGTRRGDPGGQGACEPLRLLPEHHGPEPVPPLRQPQSRPHHHLRGGGAPGRAGRRAVKRLPRPVPRAPRRRLADERHRAGRAQDGGADRPAQGERQPRASRFARSSSPPTPTWRERRLRCTCSGCWTHWASA